jgi:hypothetical protein
MSRFTLSSGLSSAVVVLFTLHLMFEHTTVIPKPYFTWRGSSQDVPVAASQSYRSRLSLTLDGNEQRYQEAVANRYKLMKELGGASIPACVYLEVSARLHFLSFNRFPEPHTKFYRLWDFFVPAFSCPFPVYRVGEFSLLQAKP